MNTPAALLLTLACLLSAACGQTARADEPAAAVQAEPTKQPETAKQPETETVAAKLLTDAAALQQAQQSLAAHAEFGGNSVQVFEKIHFFDGTFPRIELAAQNPKQPETLLFYTYLNGQWQTSEAEDISRIKRLSRHLFPLDSVHFADAAARAAQWQSHAAQVQAVEQQPYYVAFIYLPKQNQRFWHTATLEAVGAQYYLSFHEDGSVWEFKPLQGGGSEE